MNNITPEIELAEKLVQITWLAFQAALNANEDLGLSDPWTREVRALWAESVEAKFRLAELQAATAKAAA